MSPFLVNKKHDAKRPDLSLSPFLVSHYEDMSLEDMKKLMHFFNDRNKASAERKKPNKINRR